MSQPKDLVRTADVVVSCHMCRSSQSSVRKKRKNIEETHAAFKHPFKHGRSSLFPKQQRTGAGARGLSTGLRRCFSEALHEFPAVHGLTLEAIAVRRLEATTSSKKLALEATPWSFWRFLGVQVQEVVLAGLKGGIHMDPL